MNQNNFGRQSEKETITIIETSYDPGKSDGAYKLIACSAPMPKRRYYNSLSEIYDAVQRKYPLAEIK